MTVANDASNRRLLWSGIFAAAITAAFIAWIDVPLAHFFYGYRETAWSKAFGFITNFATGGIWYPLAIFGISAAYLRHKIRAPDGAAFIMETRAWAFMIVTMATSGVFINGVKLAVGRERPKFLFRDGTNDFHPFGLDLADCSFPSGHTQSIWTAMLALSFIYPRLRPLFFTTAILISASRIVIGAHYAGDVAAAFYIAVVAAVLWRQWFERDGLTITLGRKLDQPRTD